MRLSIEERARLFVAASPLAISGSGGHNTTFAVACALVKGFDLTVDQARPFLAEYNARLTDRWSEKELEHKLASADRSPDKEPRGYLLKAKDQAMDRPEPTDKPTYTPPPRFEFDATKLEAFAGGWASTVDLVWLANRSYSDPALVSPAKFLQTLYQAGEKILVFTEERSQGQAVWPDEAVPTSGPKGVWFLVQPVDGREHPNPRTGKFSRRSEESVLRWPYLVLESDEAPPRLWLGALAQLPLRIAAIYTSGGRSIHALVRVDGRTKLEWDDLKREMAPGLNLLGFLGADARAMTAVRLSRLPGCWREENRAMQKLLYLNPEPDCRPLKDLFPKRDVELDWCNLARVGVGDSDETGGQWLKNGLQFYAPVSVKCREALSC